MKKYLILLLLVLVNPVFSQDNNDVKIINGNVEYISSQYIYVRFDNTDGLKVSDTLFTESKGKYVPQLIIESLSSRSCATKSIGKKFTVGDQVIGFTELKNSNDQPRENNNRPVTTSNQEIVKVDTTEFVGLMKKNEEFNGRFSISGYSNLSNLPGNVDYQNWRYSLSLNSENTNNTNFSFSNYTTFRYRADEWNNVTSNIGNSLKIYDLSIAYNFSDQTKVFLGRKINRNISNIGAADGIQFETSFNKFHLGGILGSRPDYTDYGFNINFLQFGGYISRTDSIGRGQIENTISVFQQMNNQTTDRRFIYFQHNSANIFENVSFFLSSEIDLYKKISDEIDSKPRFTSLYISLRYAPYRWISTSLSYDARKNVIYYETFKNYVDQLVESALRQGFRARINLRPMKYVLASLYTGYRFRENDIRPTRNLGGSLTHSKIPFIGISANMSYINLMTNYLQGNIFGIRVSRNLFSNNIHGSFGFRNVNYSFNSSDLKLLQNIFQIDLSLRVNKSISMSLNFEATYQEKTSYSNIYTNLIARF